MSQNIDESVTEEVSSRPKPKKMSSIKKLGKLLGITSKKKAKSDTVQEETDLDEHDHDGGEFDLPIPIARIMDTNPSPQQSSRKQFSFSKPKSFYVSSDNGEISPPRSANNSAPPVILPSVSVIPQAYENKIAAVVRSASDDDTTKVVKGRHDSAIPLQISTEVEERKDINEPVSSMTQVEPVTNEEVENGRESDRNADHIATKSLRAALSTTQVWLLNYDI